MRANQHKRWLLFRGFIWAATGVACVGIAYFSFAGPPNLGGEHWQRTQEDNVRAAVFRRQIAEHRKDGETCFLTIRGRKGIATAAFVALHFAGSPFVRPLADDTSVGRHSPMLMNTPTINGYVDAATGRPALNFWADGVTWQSDAEAEVQGGGAAAMGSGDTGTFTVVWRHGHWEVSRYKTEAIF